MPRNFDPNDLSVGQVLPRDAYNGKGQLLLRHGAIIRSESQRDLIAENALATTAPTPERVEQETTIPGTPLGMIVAARWRLMSLFEQGSSYFPADLQRIAALLRRACRANADLALASIILARDAPYAIRHATNVALLCQIVASALEWDEAVIASTSAAALTMNVGMLELQQELYKSHLAPTPEQQETIRQHCTRGVELLLELGVDDPVWLATVRDHHERVDGSGYPAGKRGDDVGLPARLLALADIYCARVSARTYRAAIAPTPALRQLFLNEGARIDQTLVSQFIKVLGIYPPGTGVRLRNGAIAVVTQRAAGKHPTRVAALTTANGMRLPTPMRHNGDSPAHAIEAVVDLDALKLPLNMAVLWGADAVL